MTHTMMDSPFPAWHTEARGLSWLAHEVEDHLIPWSRSGFRHRKLLQVTSFVMAAVVTVLWTMAASGQVRGNIVIAWWLAWSVMEVCVRLACKPYVKEGVWWGRHYRHAGTMDMICYVGFKNLLIGASLFIGLKSFGMLSV